MLLCLWDEGIPVEAEESSAIALIPELVPGGVENSQPKAGASLSQKQPYKHNSAPKSQYSSH